jgi:hypothetical protein
MPTQTRTWRARRPRRPAGRRPVTRRTVALAVAAAVAVAGAVMLRRRRGAAAEPSPPPRRHVVCSCGQEYEVAGADRHRVYWLAGAADGDPVLGQNCPACQAPLPA